MKTKEEKQKWYQTLALKLVVLGFLSLVLLIPLEMVKSVIRERVTYSNQARQEISTMWSGRQVITGPVLNVPIIYPKNENGKLVNHSSIIHIMPEDLNIKGNIIPEIRYKGIYKTVLYTSNTTMSGEFVLPEKGTFAADKIEWDKAYFTLGISDNRGIRESIPLHIGDTSLKATPGVTDTDLFKSGITFNYPITQADGKIPFTLSMALNGSENLSFNPIGRKTSIHLTSDWKDPAFTGEFLPITREVNENGFKADWVITELNRSFPQHWEGKLFKVNNQQLGVDFLLMADHYQKAMRSTKYGILFIILTFVILVFVELLLDSKIELFHYLLIALALILFFSLLTALSEHIGFNLAYLIGSLSIVGLISFFSWGFMDKKWSVFVVNGLLILFYLFIFVLLSLKDYAYLAGNVGLLVILGVIMGISRKMKFNFTKEKDDIEFVE